MTPSATQVANKHNIPIKPIQIPNASRSVLTNWCIRAHCIIKTNKHKALQVQSGQHLDQLQQTHVDPSSLENVLEYDLVHTFVHLIILLVPSTLPQIQIQIANHLIDLASIFGSVNKSETVSLIDPIQLFTSIGPNLAHLATHSVPLLTSFLTHHQPSVRTIATLAITHLLSTHHALFDLQEQLNIVWDLVFALTSAYTKPVHHFGTYRRHQKPSVETVDRSDRRFIIDALTKLAFVFEKQADLVAEVVHALFRLSVKTELERAVIKSALKRLALTPNINMPVLLIEQIRTEDDDALDMVAWAVTHLVNDSVVIDLLEPHLLSPQPAIRYGCALIVATYCQVHKDQVTTLAPILTLGYFDPCSSVSLVLRSLLNELETLPVRLVEQYKADMPLDLIERVASGIEYLTHSAEQLTALTFLDVWVIQFKSVESVPLLLIQSLVLCLRSPDIKVCTLALKVLANLVTTSQTLLNPHVQLIWQYLCTLPPDLWTLEAKLFPSLAPLLQSQPDFYTQLVVKMFNNSPQTRCAIYTVLKQMCNPKSDQALAVGILVLALGDMDHCALVAATDALAVYKPGLKLILNQLCVTRLATNELSALVPIYEDLASATVDLGLMSKLVTIEPSMDVIWYVYLPKSMDQSVTPSSDEYEFATAIRVHSPMWLGMVLHRLKVLPPPVSSMTSKRTEVPSLLSLRRRFYCGYILLMFPMLGFPDIAVRQAACLSVVMSVIPKGQVNNAACKSLIDYTTSVLVSHKAWAYVCSAMDIASLLIRLKISAVSQYMYAYFIGYVIDWALNSPTPPIRVCALNLLNVMCSIFPLCISPRLIEIRDMARKCAVDSDEQVSRAAAKVYVQVYSLVLDQDAQGFVEYVFNELSIIRAHSPLHLQADPLLQNLTPSELNRVVVLHLFSLAQIKYPQLAAKIVQTCLPMLSSPFKLFRQYALTAVLQQYANLSASEKIVAGWACLPLFADSALSVASIIAKYMTNGFCFNNLVNESALILPNPEDSISPPVLSLDEIFDGQDTYCVTKQNQDQLYSNNQQSKKKTSALIPTETFEQTPQNIGSLISALAGKVSAIQEPQVMYNFERAADNKHLLTGTLIALSEFCCMHESALSHVTGVLVKHVQARNKTAMTAIIRLSEHSTQTFQYILDKFLTLLANSSALEVGIMECLRMLVPSICSLNGDKADYMLASLIPSVTKGRFHFEARVMAADLVVDLLVHLKTEHSPDRIVHVTNFFDNLHNVILKGESSDSVYETLRRLTTGYNPQSHPHQLFVYLKDQAIKFAFEGTENERLEAIDMMSCTCMDNADTHMCHILFLADDRLAVVAKAIRLLKPDPSELLAYIQQHGTQYVSKVINQIMTIWLQLARNVTSSSFDGVSHLFAVTKKLFQVADLEAGEQVQQILIDHLKVASANSHRLRAAQFNAISKSPLSFEEYAGIRIVESVEGLVTPGALSQFNTRASVDDNPQPMNDGGTEETHGAKGQVSNEFDAHRTYLLGNLADRQAELDYWVNSQTHLLTILGCAQAFKPDILLHHLLDDHRGVRSAAVQALITLKMDPQDASDVINSSLTSLQNDARNTQHNTSQRLQYRKLDHLRLIVGLGRESNLFSADVLDALILSWRDPIQSVRVSAISLVRHLRGFDAVGTSRLMEAIGAHVSRDDYPEQFALQELMAWFVSQMHN